MDAAEMEQHCSDDRMKSRFLNHMKPSGLNSVTIYLISIACMGLTKASHDIMLLCNKPEVKTLKVQLVSLSFAMVACASCFAWSVAAVEVFAAPDSDHGRNCNCYYEIPTLGLSIALGTPLLLLFHIIAGTGERALALQHGDYLSFMKYQLPWRIAITISPKDPTRTTVHSNWVEEEGSHQKVKAPPHSLTFSQMSHLASSLKLLHTLFKFFCYTALSATIFPVLFVRVVCFAMNSDGTMAWHMKWVLCMLGVSVPFLSAYAQQQDLIQMKGLLTGVHEGEENKKTVAMGIAVRLLLWVVLPSIMPVVLVPQLLGVAKMSVTQQGQNSWTWMICGFYVALFPLIAANKVLLGPHLESLDMRTLKRGPLSGKDWPSIADKYPEWLLKDHWPSIENKKKNDIDELKNLMMKEKVPHRQAADQFLKLGSKNEPLLS